MTDKELLKLAARAVGLDFKHSQSSIWLFDKNNLRREWNPLIDKADCLQLEIDLKFNISHQGKWVIRRDNGFLLAEHKDRQRASVMAAAEIGRGMG